MVATSIMVTIIWYMMAVKGIAPANMSPDIIPGRVTMPKVFAESSEGCMPDLMDSLKIDAEACFGVAPRESFSRICCLWSRKRELRFL